MFSSKSKTSHVQRCGRLGRPIVLCAVLSLFFWPLIAAHAKVFQTLDEALARLFPDAIVQRTTVYLTEEQQKEIRERAGVEMPNAIIYPYHILRDNQIIATAYLDTHRVRTLQETLMIAVGPNHEILNIEVLSFNEPQDYIPPDRWYLQFIGKLFSPELQMKKGIDGVAGATLTSRATINAARRVLSIHIAINEGHQP